MNRDLLLKEIAPDRLQRRLCRKNHLATFDVVEKAPGWLTLATLAIGVFALVTPSLADNLVGVTVLVVGIASLYFNSYIEVRSRYETVGVRLTVLFTELRTIYYAVQSRAAAVPLDDLEARYRAVLSDSQQAGISRQIFLSDRYAHYKFFRQAQTGWLDDQLHFGCWRDKVPLTATLSVVAIGALIAAAALR